MRNLLRKLTPGFILELYRSKKKDRVRHQLLQKKQSGDIVTEALLISQLRATGIKEGDTLLVHSSMSKIGFLENGPKTFIDALIGVVGTSGNILMPSSPNPALQKDFAKSQPVFDVLNTPSVLGAITEYFRKMPGVVRSLHPTEPVCAFGPDAVALTEGHAFQSTPYNKQSPFYKVGEKHGKILYVGVTLINAGTSLHILEDLVPGFKFPVYFNETYDFKIIDEAGNQHIVNSVVHNPIWSAKRRCDELIPIFEQEGILQKIKIGEADTLLVNAEGLTETMLRLYSEKGVTMYTPGGKDLN